jgi:thiosulfate reductase cytochrome b subunit
MARYLRRRPNDPDDEKSYNTLQRIAYLAVIFVLVPLTIWTGLAMSPTFNAAFPFFVNSLGGRQSARTLHFLDTILLVVFLVVHVWMVYLAGFRSRVWAMIGGESAREKKAAAIVAQEVEG